jgi:hypothetical protein
MKIEGQKFNGGIRKNDEFILVKEKVAGAYYMTQCSKGISVFIGDWIDLVKKRSTAQQINSADAKSRAAD